MAHYAKPGNEPAFVVRWNVVTKRWLVVGPGNVVEGEGYIHEKNARSRARQKNGSVAHRKQRTDRPCMCCQRPFPSEGIHNRLCDICRRAASEQRPATYRNPGKRYA